MSALPGFSDINFFRYCQGVIDFDAEIPDGAFELGMPQQELNGPEIARPSIDLGGLGTPQRMRAEQPRVARRAANARAELPSESTMSLSIGPQ
jgi:hypothetical protein